MAANKKKFITRLMSIITIIRHGTTEGIEKGKLQGSTDSPLSSRGRLEAQLTAEALKTKPIKTCYCSPLGRARETAAIICKPLGIKPVILEDLREYDFGWLEGHRYFKPPAANASILIKLKSLARLSLANISGESLPHIRLRAKAVWEYLLEQNLDGQNLIITHGFFINIFFQELMRETTDFKSKLFDVNACSLTEIELINNHPQLLRMNDISHLKVLKTNDH
jgi:broad specificity phosphatase PhoE